MKRLITTCGLLSLLAVTAASAQPTGDKGAIEALELAKLLNAPSGDGVSRAARLQRMRSDGIPEHWFPPSAPLRVAPPEPEPPAPDPFVRSRLLDDIDFRSDGTLGHQLSHDYDGLGRSLGRSLVGDRLGRNVRVKRVEDGVGISIDFN